MIVLGIDTATPVCAVGIADDSGPRAEMRLLAGNAHAEQLPDCVQNLLDRAGLSIGALDGIAVSIGPGSYTGLRIGLAFAKGMSCALDKPIAAVPTMDGLARAAPTLGVTACVLIHSRKGEVYRGLYRAEGEQWLRTGGFETVETPRLGEGIPGDGVLFLGEGARMHRSAGTTAARTRPQTSRASRASRRRVPTRAPIPAARGR